MIKPKNKSKIPPLSTIYRRIAISFVVLTVLLVGVIIFFSVAKATIVITPQKEIRSAEFLVTIKANPASGSANINGVFQKKEVEEEAQFESAGLTEKQGYSGGVINVINSTTASQTLVATTRFLSTGNVLFRTTEKVTVPANGSASVKVKADEPGAKGDIDAAKFTIPGLRPEKQEFIYGESKDKMSGGGMSVRAVTAEDLNRAKLEVVEKAEKNIKDEFSKDPAAVLGGVIVSSEVLEVSFDAKEGEEKQTFTAVVKMNAQILAYDKKALDDLALRKVIANMPTDRELEKFNEDSMIVKIKNINEESGEVQLSIYADGDSMLNASSPILDPVKVAGMSVNDAEQYLKSFDAVENVKIKLFPSWQKKIPAMPDRIKIVIVK